VFPANSHCKSFKLVASVSKSSTESRKHQSQILGRQRLPQVPPGAFSPNRDNSDY